MPTLSQSAWFCFAHLVVTVERSNGANVGWGVGTVEGRGMFGMLRPADESQASQIKSNLLSVALCTRAVTAYSFSLEL
eukprot:239346-Rhodomonas_salina.1